jgi:serine/threonine-protein kinase
VQLIDPIGDGGSGTVWRAWQTGRRRYVAVKVPRDGSPPQGREPPVSHPHVLTGEPGPGGTLVLPLVRGGTADQLLAEHGILPATYVAVLLDQLLGALVALHATGWVHRDVKPANLLLEPTGAHRPHLHLADLGCAAPQGRPPPTSAGTVGYLAPELEPGGDPLVVHDLYAVGVTAVELLTGRVPRDRGSVPPGPLRPLLHALTDPRPDGRPPTAAAALVRLRALGLPAGEPWRSGPGPPFVPDRLRPLTLRERWRARRVRG